VAGFEDVRALALGFPEAVEMDHHGFPSFRVAGKIFCTLRDGPPRLMVKLDPEDQGNLCDGHPDVITPVPGYWGRKGATFVDYARAPADLLETLLAMAWSGVAPKRLRRSA
jgi:hypothetical protein